MRKAILIVPIGAVPAMTGGSASGKLGGSNDQSAAAQKDYDRLAGTWQLTRAVVRKAGSRKCVAKKQS